MLAIDLCNLVASQTTQPCADQRAGQAVIANGMSDQAATYSPDQGTGIG